MSLIPQAELEGKLAHLAGWSGDPSGITASFTMADFPTAIELVVQVARAAEAANHHPDVDIRWRTVSFRLVTHDAGGVSGLDLELAGVIGDTARELGWRPAR